jgi:hypothetical protein
MKLGFYYSCIHSIPCLNEMSFTCMSIICGPTCIYVSSLSFTLHKTKHKDHAERFYHKYITNSVALVRGRTIPTKQPQLVSEVNDNFSR